MLMPDPLPESKFCVIYLCYFIAIGSVFPILFVSRAYWGFADHFKEQAEALLSSLDLTYKRVLQVKRSSLGFFPECGFFKLQKLWYLFWTGKDHN
jgi:hypothetical protein